MNRVLLITCFVIFELCGSDAQFNPLQQFFPSPQPPTFRPNTPVPFQQPVTNRITAAPVTVNPDCCAVNPLNQVECGYAGITEDRCIARRCCYNASPLNKFWCFRPQQEPCVGLTPPPITTQATLPQTTASILTCVTPPNDRRDCGYDGINKEQCTKLGCCFDDKVSGQVPHCFFSKDKAPRFSRWSDWSKCPEKDCEKKEQKRERFCTYFDGRKAPITLCIGNTEDKRKCACKKPCKDELGEESCKTWTGLCDNNEVVQKNCEKTCKMCKEETVVTSSLQTCKDKSTLCSRFTNLCKTSKPFKNSMCVKTCGACKVETKVSSTELPKSTQATIPTIIAVTFETPKTYGDCKDKYISCRNITEYCTRPKHYNDLKELCPVTCNLCSTQQTVAPLVPTQPLFTPPATPQTPIFTAAPVTSASFLTSLSPVNDGQCVDLLTSCSSYEEFCNTSNTVLTQCPATCKVCSKTSPVTFSPSTTSTATTQAPVIECRDKITTCDSYEASCEESEDIRNLCPVTCKVCSAQSPIYSTVASPQIATISIVSATSATKATPESKAPIDIEDCKDKASGCQNYVNLCKESEHASTMQDLCPLTCNVCSPRAPNSFLTLMSSDTPATLSITARTPPASSVGEKCEDTLDVCSQYSFQCEIPTSNWKTLCPKTCGECGKQSDQNNYVSPTPQSSTISATAVILTTTTPTECVDKVPTCNVMKPYCNADGELGKATKENCYKTCVCGNTPSPQKVSTKCEDRLKTCNTMQTYCNADGELGKTTRELCYKTCVCGKENLAPTLPSTTPTPPETPTECKDRVETCNVMQTYCNADGELGQTTRELCYKTCVCGKENVAPTLTQSTASPFLPWSTWTTCSKTCATGFRSRTRLCKSPVSGINCQDEVESEICSFNPCPITLPTAQSPITTKQVAQEIKDECKDKAVPTWCDQMIKDVDSFCSNEELALNCLATCNKCP